MSVYKTRIIPNFTRYEHLNDDSKTSKKKGKIIKNKRTSVLPLLLKSPCS